MARVVSRLLCMYAVVAFLSAPALAGDTNNSVPGVQDVIAGQIAAFRAGDSNLAYSFASPDIQRIFPTPGIFMRMVEQGYEPVFRPRSFAFIDQQKIGEDDVMQHVDVVGPDGSPWIATYTLRKQPDGTWKITGCQLRPGAGA